MKLRNGTETEPKSHAPCDRIDEPKDWIFYDHFVNVGGETIYYNRIYRLAPDGKDAVLKWFDLVGKCRSWRFSTREGWDFAHTFALCAIDSMGISPDMV